MLTQPPTCSFLAGSVAPDVAARVFGTISKFFDDYSRLVPAFDRAFNVSTDKNRPFSDLIPVFPELCPHPQRYPERSLDGGKVSCHHAWLNSSDCVVLSLGSNNDFQFEESISAQSLCRTHTYDCTSNPPPRPILRHSFSKKCLGNSTNDLFVSYASALREAHAHKVDYLKIDIEGAEHIVFPHMLQDLSQDRWPQQIASEVHIYKQYTPAVMIATYRMLFERGYVIAYREENPLTRHATEVVFLRLFCERGVAGT